MSPANSMSNPASLSHRRNQLLARVGVVIEKARRNRRTLAVDAETARLAAEYRDCPMSRTELRATIVRLARQPQK